MRRLALLGFAAALATAACGQKGPLYLPDRNAAVVTTPAPPPAAVPAAAPPASPPASPPKKPDADSGAQPPK